jgi:hypothetical protein
MILKSNNVHNLWFLIRDVLYIVFLSFSHLLTFENYYYIWGAHMRDSHPLLVHIFSIRDVLYILFLSFSHPLIFENYLQILYNNIRLLQVASFLWYNNILPSLEWINRSITTLAEKSLPNAFEIPYSCSYQYNYMSIPLHIASQIQILQATSQFTKTL